MTNRQEDTKRVIRNTMFLYFRMILVMAVSFLTTRITLRVLGVVDFGIQNLVAGAVSFLGILTGTMTSATQRFLAFDLGKKDIEHFQLTFNTIIIVFIALSCLVLIIGEAVGNWLIYDYLVIPKERTFAAYWSYQFALLMFIITMMTIPFTSSCIAYEKMDVFGYISILEALLKLAVVYLLYLSTYDKLITISILNTLVQALLLFIYIFYCTIRLQGCKFKICWNPNLLRNILGYTGWNLFGSVSGVLCTSGLTIILNLFFGPVINAAKAIADKVNQLAIQLSSNFFQASAPLIVKSYASGETDYTKKIVCESSKFSYYLMLIVTMTIIFVIKDILSLWLGGKYVTNEMVTFTQWILIYSLVNVLEQPLTMIVRATGDIRSYQVSVGCVTLMVLPVCYLLFKLGYAPVWSIIALTIVYGIAHIVRMVIVKGLTDLKITVYIKEVVKPIVLVTLTSFLVLYPITYFTNLGKIRIFVYPTISCFVTLACICICGMNRGEKEILIEKINSRRYRKTSEGK